VTRTYEVDGDVLTYQMAMAYGDTRSITISGPSSAEPDRFRP
jgi:hypothetical protein